MLPCKLRFVNFDYASKVSLDILSDFCSYMIYNLRLYYQYNVYVQYTIFIQKYICNHIKLSINTDLYYIPIVLLHNYMFSIF